MRTIRIVAEFPTSPEEAEAVTTTFQKQQIVKKLLAEPSGPDFSRIASISGADEYMVEDVAAVQLGMRPLLNEYAGAGFWTFGRTHPRFGSAWAKLMLDDTNEEAYLLIRTGGSFEDIETPPQWVSCKIVSIDTSFETFSRLVKLAFLRDYWCRPEGSRIVGTVVLHEQES